MENSKTLRGLSQDFLDDLKTGTLKDILEKVQKDRTLLLQIRDEYINVYYRGCSALKLSRKDNSYIAEIHKNYVSTQKGSPEKEDLEITETENLAIFKDFNTEKWLKELPSIKSKIDKNLDQNDRSEREFQQLVVRENSFSKLSNGTDYFIIDTECAGLISDARFDMLAIKWTTANRKDSSKCQLALIEMKYGDTSLNNLKDHYSHINQLFANKKTSEDLKAMALTQFKQLRELGLINIGNNSNEVTTLADKPEFILLCANHSPNSIKLYTELNTIPQENSNVELRFATASFMGYGLYDKCMLNYDEFSKLLKQKP